MNNLNDNLAAMDAAPGWMDYPGGRDAFQLDLYKHNGLDLSKVGTKADRAFNLAWEYQHSDGYQAVADMFGDLVYLFT